jgi:hypothetical protein
MEHLSLEIREIDDVAIDQSDCPDTGGSQVERGRRAKTAGADEQDLRLCNLLLPFSTDFGQKNVTAIAGYLFFSKFHL